MLELVVYDDTKRVVLQFEHSLLAVSKWESRTRKAFMSSERKLSGDVLSPSPDSRSRRGCSPSPPNQFKHDQSRGVLGLAHRWFNWHPDINAF